MPNAAQQQAEVPPSWDVDPQRWRIPRSQTEWAALQAGNYKLWERVVLEDDRRKRGLPPRPVGTTAERVVDAIRGREDYPDDIRKIALSEVEHTAEVTASRWCSSALRDMRESLHAEILAAQQMVANLRTENDALRDHQDELRTAERRRFEREVADVTASLRNEIEALRARVEGKR